jgi:hypothetical protein
MKRVLIIVFLTTICLTATPTQEAKAAIAIAKIIKEAVKKVIKAVDLMIQRLQNKTIWLQNAQKVLELKSRSGQRSTGSYTRSITMNFGK